MEEIKEGSFEHSTDLPSLQLHQSLATPLSTFDNDPLWTRNFKLIKKSDDHNAHPDTFIAKSRTRMRYVPVTSVDSTAGSGECLAQTQKQWDTIVKKAKADDKVLDVMKAANFFHFGKVVRDLKSTRPAKAYKLVRDVSESDADLEMDQLPLPLEAYAENRRRKIRRRLLIGSVPCDPEGSEILPTQPSFMDEFDNIPVTLTRIEGDSGLNVPHSSPVRRFKSGHDLSYLKFAAEEHLNDSELIKGIGRVPINRKTPDPVAAIEDRAWELPMDAWAFRDLKFLLQKMITSDLKINNHMILPSLPTLPSLDDPEALLLEWNGKTERKICVVKSHRIKSIYFKDVIMIKYNRQDSMLLFQFSSENSSKSEELLLILSPVSDKDWQILQTCCYSLVRGKPSMQQCDKEGQEFFEDKAKALMNLRIKWPPKVLIPNRPALQAINKGVNVTQRFQKPLSVISKSLPKKSADLEVLHTELLKGSIISPVPSSLTSASSRNQTGNLGQSRLSSIIIREPERAVDNDRDDLSSSPDSTDNESEAEPENSTLITEDTDVDIDNRISPNVALEVEETSPTGLYYKSILKSGIPLPVRLNDVVARLRSEKERESGGKSDKLDLFDGPWRIVEFGSIENTHCMNIPDDVDRGERSETPSPFRYDAREVKKMLKTRVMLGFPRESHANRWIELSRLVPVSKLEDVRNGKLHASCWGVTELPAFKVLQSEMVARNLTTFDPKSQIFRAEKFIEKPIDSRENVEDGINADAMNEDDAGSVDQDEEELPMHVVEIKRGIFVAMMEANPKAVDDGDSYLVEKLRSKRLRLLKLNSPVVKKNKLKTDEIDPWVKLLLKESSHLATNRVVVSEYKVHWAGWPDEDDTWDIGTGNIAQEFIDEYHAFTDFFRDISMGMQVANPRDMIFKDDLPKQNKVRKSGGGRSRARPSLDSAKKVSEGETHVMQDDEDEEMVDADGEIAIARALQASVDDVNAMKTKPQLENLQKEVGVEIRDFAYSTANDSALEGEDDTFMECDEQGGGEEEKDATMAEGDDFETPNSHSNGAGDNE